MSNINTARPEVVGQDPYMDYSANQAGYVKKDEQESGWTNVLKHTVSTGGNVLSNWLGGGSSEGNAEAGMPGWVLPVAIGGIGIIGFAVLAGGKKRRR